MLEPARGAPVLVAWDVRRLIVDEKTTEFLRVMREQIRGTNSREVNARKAARTRHGPGYPEYENRSADLIWARYLHPHPNSSLCKHGVHLITARGIKVADEVADEAAADEAADDEE